MQSPDVSGTLQLRLYSFNGKGRRRNPFPASRLCPEDPSRLVDQPRDVGGGRTPIIDVSA